MPKVKEPPASYNPPAMGRYDQDHVNERARASLTDKERAAADDYAGVEGDDDTDGDETPDPNAPEPVGAQYEGQH